MVRKIQDLRKQNKLNINDSIEVTYPQDELNDKIVANHGEEIMKKVVATELAPGSDFEIKVVE